MLFKKNTILLPLFFLVFINSYGQHYNQSVKIIGKMSDVMRNGNLKSTIILDTISNKTNLYGLGPLDSLKGEVIILNGRIYKSFIQNSRGVVDSSASKLAAPFFSYANISKWLLLHLPDSVINLRSLDEYLSVRFSKSVQPFYFKLTGKIDAGTIHIVNLPSNYKIKSPSDARTGQVNFDLKEQKVIILGFFSFNHKSIFTHHDTNMHLHLLTGDRVLMGHVDELTFNSNNLTIEVQEF
jgi:acetolactate decarboxylase